MAVSYYLLPLNVLYASLAFVIIVTGINLMDWLKKPDSRDYEDDEGYRPADDYIAHELILLNENEEAIRTWDLTGQIAMLIGRKNKYEDVDIDLSDCEYSALVSNRHAVLNYSLDSWYLEDLDTENKIRIQKSDDGNCYQVNGNHPVKISAGDIIYIARTRLLFN